MEDVIGRIVRHRNRHWLTNRLCLLAEGFWQRAEISEQ